MWGGVQTHLFEWISHHTISWKDSFCPLEVSWLLCWKLIDNGSKGLFPDSELSSRDRFHSECVCPVLVTHRIGCYSTSVDFWSGKCKSSSSVLLQHCFSSAGPFSCPHKFSTSLPVSAKQPLWYCRKGVVLRVTLRRVAIGATPSVPAANTEGLSSPVGLL